MNDESSEVNDEKETAPAAGGNNAINQAAALINAIRSEVNKVLVGQSAVVDQVLLALIGGGHVLIEGVPGLGKTLLVRALAKCFGGKFSRVQFTPDLMPSDVTGHAMFNMQEQKFEIRKGPVFTHLLLADEINRAPAKTQAALLEVMQESQITIEGESYRTDDPFMVLATQNPVEQEGTYPLPEAELDRFMLKVFIDYPQAADELSIVRAIVEGKSPTGFDLSAVKTLVNAEHILRLRKIVQHVTVDQRVLEYMVTLVRVTREWGGLSRGAGPRASIALLSASRALALLRGKAFVTPDDVQEVFLPALRHRILLAPELEIEGANEDHVLGDILRSVEAPRA